MGTRAIITFKKYQIATHWDGDDLGKELNGVKTLKEVRKIANEHKIDGIGLKSKRKFKNWLFDYGYVYIGKGKWDVAKWVDG